MALLDIVKDAAILLGLSPPAALASSTDPTDQQMMLLATQVGREMAAFHDWSALMEIGTFTGTGVQLAFPLPDDFSRFGQGQLFLLDGGYVRLQGPLDPIQLTALVAQSVASISNQFYRVGSNITIQPALDNGRKALFVYQKKNWRLSSSGEPGDRFRQDTDTCVFPEELVTLGLVWMWRRTKGFDYAQEYEDWRQRCELEAGRDSPLIPVSTTPALTDLPDPVIPDTIRVL